MSIYIVVVAKSGGKANYSAFDKAVSRFARCQISDAAWLIDSTLGIDVIRNELFGELMGLEEALIAEITHQWETRPSSRVEDWLLSKSRRWTANGTQSILKRFLGQ